MTSVIMETSLFLLAMSALLLFQFAFINAESDPTIPGSRLKQLEETNKRNETPCPAEPKEQAPSSTDPHDDSKPVYAVVTVVLVVVLSMFLVLLIRCHLRHRRIKSSGTSITLGVRPCGQDLPRFQPGSTTENRSCGPCRSESDGHDSSDPLMLLERINVYKAENRSQRGETCGIFQRHDPADQPYPCTVFTSPFHNSPVLFSAGTHSQTQGRDGTDPHVHHDDSAAEEHNQQPVVVPQRHRARGDLAMPHQSDSAQSDGRVFGLNLMPRAQHQQMDQVQRMAVTGNTYEDQRSQRLTFSNVQPRPQHQQMDEVQRDTAPENTAENLYHPRLITLFNVRSQHQHPQMGQEQRDAIRVSHAEADQYQERLDVQGLRVGDLDTVQPPPYDAPVSYEDLFPEAVYRMYPSTPPPPYFSSSDENSS